MNPTKDQIADRFRQLAAQQGVPVNDDDIDAMSDIVAEAYGRQAPAVAADPGEPIRRGDTVLATVEGAGTYNVTFA